MIQSKIQQVVEKKITFGFDGFSDTILKVIRSKTTNQTTSYFSSINEFGTYIVDKGERNFSLELEQTTTKIGGNMPIMANALAQFGPKQYCIGSMGFPDIDPIFKKMPSNCTLYSFANPGWTKAIEFNGNKIMLAEIGELNQIEWKDIRETIGFDTFIKLFSESDLVSLLNWSELDNSTDIWKGILSDILPNIPKKKKKPIGFFDIADCSKRTHGSILEAMTLLREFSSYWDVVLSLNLNEAIIVNDVISEQTFHEKDVENIGSNLFKELSIDSLVIHYSKQSLAWNKTGVYKKDSFYVSDPKLSTGAGDNFNAGFCAGMLMDLDTETSLLLGHAMSSYYMQYARSPTKNELLQSLQSKLLAGIPSIL